MDNDANVVDDGAIETDEAMVIDGARNKDCDIVENGVNEDCAVDDCANNGPGEPLKDPPMDDPEYISGDNVLVYRVVEFWTKYIGVCNEEGPPFGEEVSDTSDPNVTCDMEADWGKVADELENVALDGVLLHTTCK